MLDIDDAQHSQETYYDKKFPMVNKNILLMGNTDAKYYNQVAIYRMSEIHMLFRALMY